MYHVDLVGNSGSAIVSQLLDNLQVSIEHHAEFCLQVRPFAKELYLQDDAGVSIVKTTSLSDFSNCSKISYSCTDEDPHCLQAMNMTLSCAVSQIPQLQAVELDLMSIANG